MPPPRIPDRRLTTQDLGALPPYGGRVELIHGAIMMGLRPDAAHQKALGQLTALLVTACPPGLHVLPAPFPVRPTELDELQPDLLVAREEDLTPLVLPTAPVLVVEIVSPRTALHDTLHKKAAYERLGVRSYWIVDPRAPGLAVHELIDGRYHLTAEALADTPFHAVHPFPVTVTPAALLGTLAH
ncbi:MAG TPA: Uma2 family endonuclease [Pseudonocardiaceae bacterium]